MTVFDKCYMLLYDLFTAAPFNTFVIDEIENVKDFAL